MRRSRGFTFSISCNTGCFSSTNLSKTFRRIEAMPALPLKSMSIEKLTKLQAEVEAALSAKVVEERRELEAKLSHLSRLDNGHARAPGRRGRPTGSSSSLSGTTVAPKYRNPENPSETWAGRGLKPRWLTAAMKSGKKLEDFAIAGKAAAASKKMPAKERGRPRKTA
jgi:DNA-binding protein H-NS